MIVVVEGISAAGKTTWCRHHAPGRTVPETGPVNAPVRAAAPREAALFWAARNAERWQSALALESRLGLAVCDSDPLKLHYIWTLWRIGEASLAQWLDELAVTRAAIEDKRLGFADLYLLKHVTPAQARLQQAGDPKRTRRQFELHLRLQEPLMAWYRTFSAVLPMPVRFVLPQHAVAEDARAWPDARYDLTLFDEIVRRLGADLG